MHLIFVCKMSFCVDHNILLVSSDCVWDKLAAMFQTELWKKIQKLYKRKSIWKRRLNDSHNVSAWKC